MNVRRRPEVFVLQLASPLLPPGVDRVRYSGAYALASLLPRHAARPPVPARISRTGGRWSRWYVVL